MTTLDRFSDLPIYLRQNFENLTFLCLDSHFFCACLILFWCQNGINCIFKISSMKINDRLSTWINCFIVSDDRIGPMDFFISELDLVGSTEGMDGSILVVKCLIQNCLC